MKYEVIKEYPGCGQIKKGYTVDVKYAYGYDNGQRCVDGFTCSFNTRYMSHVYKDEKSDILQITLDFHPSNYPEFFKPIEYKPKWIDKQMIVAEISRGAATRCATIEIHKNGLYTREDIVEFAAYLRGHSSNLYNEVFITPKLDDWVNKKLQS